MATFKEFKIWDLSEDKVPRKDEDKRVINIEHIIEVKGVGSKNSGEAYMVYLVNRDWFVTTTPPTCEVREFIFGNQLKE